MGGYVLRHWYRKGLRKRSLQMAAQATCIKLLNWCPTPLFHLLARWLPLPQDIRENYYNQREKYAAYLDDARGEDDAG